MRINDLRLSTKLGAMIGLAVLCLVCTCVAALETSYNRMVADRLGKARAVVDMTVSLAESLDKQVEAGSLTRDAALKQFAEVAAAQRYDGGNYVFVFGYDGLGYASAGSPGTVGNRSALDVQDKRGVRFIKSLIDTARNHGAGNVTYYLPHAGETTPVRKVSAVRGFAPWQLAIGSGVYTDDVTTEMWSLVGRLAAVAIPLLLLLVAAGVLTYRSVVGGLSGLAGSMNGLAAGNLAVVVPGAERRDEVGRMAQAVEVFRRGMAEAQRLTVERQAEDAGKAARAGRIEALTSSLEAQLGELAGHLSGNATVLEATARGMSDTALNTNRQTAAVAGAAQQASANVQTVAAAAEQLSASIHEISRQVAQSADVAVKATENARRTDTVVQALSEGAGKIGEVVGLINSIAGQTNLLALNATIEAARAGEAGKGFAVVASEVKNLASQTAKATEEIGAQISQIQRATGEVVVAIREIGGVIDEMGQISGSIAAAVQEQGSATAEISHNVHQATTGTEEVTGTIGRVDRAATETGLAAGQVLEVAAQVAGQATQLEQQFRQFLANMRAA
ncbi:MAG: methyl-accepting chemotaxis protein [Janthinobacterium lividum]